MAKTARMQLLLPPELDEEIRAFADARRISANEAVRQFCRIGLDASTDQPPSVPHLLAALEQRFRELEDLLATRDHPGE